MRRLPHIDNATPWDPTYGPWPYERPAFDHWAIDVRAQQGRDVKPYNNYLHDPGSMFAAPNYDSAPVNPHRIPAQDRNSYFYSQAGCTMCGYRADGHGNGGNGLWVAIVAAILVALGIALYLM